MIDPTDQELAASYALDLLEPQHRAEFEQALAAEPDLRQLVRDFQDVSAALALDCPAQRVPAETWPLIRLQVEWDRERTHSRKEMHRRARWTMAGWAAAACLALGWGWSWSWRQPGSAQSSPTVEARNDGVGETRSLVPAATGSNSAVGAAPASAQEWVVQNEPPRIDPATNQLRAQLDAARAREQRWSQALAAALNQITNLASQLDAAGTSVPGTRHARWLGLAPPGQPHLADQAIETILNRLPGILTNLAFPPMVDANATPDQTPEQDLQLVNQGGDPTNPGAGSGPVGVAFWDGRSATMMVAIAGVDTPPPGQQLVLWGAPGAGQALGANAVPFNSLGILGSHNAGNGQVILIPAPGGSPAATPRLLVTLEPVGAPLVTPNGPVVIRTP